MKEERYPTVFSTWLMLLIAAIGFFIALLYEKTNFAMFFILILVTMYALKIWARFSKRKISYHFSLEK